MGGLFKPKKPKPPPPPKPAPVQPAVAADPSAERAEAARQSRLRAGASTILAGNLGEDTNAAKKLLGED